MPNWCNTTYKCEGKKSEIKELEKVLKECENMEKPLVENDFGNLWLGCIITKLGFDWKAEKYERCRGWIDYYETDGNGVLTIQQETAWEEQEGFRNAIKDKFPSIKVYYADEEIGDCYFSTNDKEGKYFKGGFVLEDWNGFDYYSFEDIVQIVKERTHMSFPHNYKGIQNALVKWNDTARDEDNLSVWKVKYYK